MSDHPIVEFMRERIYELAAEANVARRASSAAAEPLYAQPEFVLDDMWHRLAMVEYLSLEIHQASGEVPASRAGQIFVNEAKAVAFLRHMAAPFRRHPDYQREWAA